VYFTWAVLKLRLLQLPVGVVDLQEGGHGRRVLLVRLGVGHVEGDLGLQGAGRVRQTWRIGRGGLGLAPTTVWFGRTHDIYI